MVYIQEAHPVDLWQSPSNIKDEVLFQSPSSIDERVELATLCVRNLGIEIPALIDGLDDAVEQDYTGWPDRLYLIDTAGNVAFKSDAGPYGFRPPALESALREQLGR